MAKRVEIDGKFYRWRRGKLVQIPDEWVGKTLHPQTKRKRPSKQIGKRKKSTKYQAGYGKGTRLDGHDPKPLAIEIIEFDCE